MGNYNPNAPYIIGEEWVGIRDEDIQFAGVNDFVELGHRFALGGSGQVSEGRFYINEVPSPLVGQFDTRVYNISVYRADEEATSGPVQRCVIPVNNGAVTGGIQNVDWLFVNGNSVAEVLSPEAFGNITFNYYSSGPAQRFTTYFATNQYPFLEGKRIVAVNMLLNAYAWHSNPSPQPNSAVQTLIGGSTPFMLAQVRRTNTGAGYESGDLGLIIDTSGAQEGQVRTVGLGDHFPLWSGGSSADSSTMPWTYSDLQRFELSHSDPIGIRFTQQILVDDDKISIFHVALEVLYCEETRVITGGRQSIAASRKGKYSVTLRDPITRAENKVLTPDDYAVTLSLGDPGFAGTAFGGVDLPVINALRELRTISTHPGIQINATKVEGEAFSIEETRVLPQLSLHASGGAPLSDVHAYGRQAVAEVYGSARIPTQIIYDVPPASGTEFPWIRFYARRWGDTSDSLTVRRTTDATRTAAITPAEFDALPELFGGWKEVTLRFNQAGGLYPQLGGGSLPVYQWSSTGEALGGNRWEVLGVTAPAISGAVFSNLFVQVPTTQRLGPATWGGTTAFATWSPGYVPPVSGLVADNTTDIVVIFSQDPPAVSGFSVAGASQPITGIGQECGLDPCAIPTAIVFHEITWSAVPDEAFGYYELQRRDTIDVDWQTIMHGSALTGTSFNDYEARVGIENTYRIRAVNTLEFPGPWSSELSITTAAPGVSGGCLDHVLIFTSNERQDGSVNLAYSSAWEGSSRVEEDFTFPEAGFTQFQTMYNRDYQIAFRPLERGGEQFQRTVLVQAAAIAPETLSGFRSLTDMAWDSVSYICVRDEDGNRWLANVLVPSGRVLRDRRLYLASVAITEVTDTPSPVDPWS